MPILTKQALLDSVAERWKTHHFWGCPRVWRNRYTPNSQAVYSQLKELADPTENNIAAIIGNYFWTELLCQNCKKDVSAVYQFGSDIEPLFQVCPNCLKSAVQMLEK